MFDWHLTWQDPLAVFLALGGIVLAFSLSRRANSSAGCSSCPVKSTEPRR